MQKDEGRRNGQLDKRREREREITCVPKLVYVLVASENVARKQSHFYVKRETERDREIERER